MHKPKTNLDSMLLCAYVDRKGSVYAIPSILGKNYLSIIKLDSVGK